jgi:hypothetical protein
MEHDTKNSVFALQGWNMTPNVYQLIAMQGRNKIHKVYQIIVRKEDDNIKCFFYKGLGAIRAKIGPTSDGIFCIMFHFALNCRTLYIVLQCMNLA